MIIEDLTAAIKRDIEESNVALELPENKAYQNHSFFSKTHQS